MTRDERQDEPSGFDVGNPEEVERARGQAIAAMEGAASLPDGVAKALVIGRALAWDRWELRPEDFQRAGLGRDGLRLLDRAMRTLVAEELVEPTASAGHAAMWRSRVVLLAGRPSPVRSWKRDPEPEPVQGQLNLRGRA